MIICHLRHAENGVSNKHFLSPLTILIKLKSLCTKNIKEIIVNHNPQRESSKQI